MRKLSLCFGVVLVASILLSLFCILYLRNHLNLRLRPPKQLKPAQTRHLENYIGVSRDADITWSNYTVVGDRPFYILSVIASKSNRGGARWDQIIISGWESAAAVSQTYTCCFFYADGKVTTSTSIGKRQFTVRARLEARQVLCEHPKGEKPETFGMAASNERCSGNNNRYKITYPEADHDKVFAVCGKIVYGAKSAHQLIEWIEYQVLFGADKIVLYPYQDLNMAAMKVLQFYTINDVIEIVPMSFVPDLKRWPRHFGMATNLYTMYNDEQTAMFDAQVRLHEYEYLAVFDTDEFPAMNGDIANSYSGLMRHLKSKYTGAGSLGMMTHMHSLSYNKTDPGNKLMIAQYGARSPSVMDRAKAIHFTDRIKPGSVWIHEADPINGYERYYVKDTDVVIKHFRLCPDDWLKPNPKFKPNMCYSEIQYDDYMKSIAAAITPNVRKVRDILGLNHKPDNRHQRHRIP